MLAAGVLVPLLLPPLLLPPPKPLPAVLLRGAAAEDFEEASVVGAMPRGGGAARPLAASPAPPMPLLPATPLLCCGLRRLPLMLLSRLAL
jgi:hypothetical protein